MYLSDHRIQLYCEKYIMTYLSTTRHEQCNHIATTE